MTDPIAASIAAAVATGAMAALTDGTRALVAKLAGLLRERFRRQPSDQDTLDEATHNPDDHEAVQRLAALLEQRMQEDPQFAQLMRALWSDIAPDGGGDQVTNIISGQVHGSAIQTRDVHGGITFNESSGSRAPRD